MCVSGVPGFPAPAYPFESRDSTPLNRCGSNATPRRRRNRKQGSEKELFCSGKPHPENLSFIFIFCVSLLFRRFDDRHRVNRRNESAILYFGRVLLPSFLFFFFFLVVPKLELSATHHLPEWTRKVTRLYPFLGGLSISRSPLSFLPSFLSTARS